RSHSGNNSSIRTRLTVLVIRSSGEVVGFASDERRDRTRRMGSRRYGQTGRSRRSVTSAATRRGLRREETATANLHLTTGDKLLVEVATSVALRATGEYDTLLGEPKLVVVA